jgi:hypothetical protein
MGKRDNAEGLGAGLDVRTGGRAESGDGDAAPRVAAAETDLVHLSWRAAVALAALRALTARIGERGPGP